MLQWFQVHAFGGTAGVLFYSLMASKNYVYELYGKILSLDVAQSCVAALLIYGIGKGRIP
jgi:ammonia channel protein AmtB